MTTPNIPQRPIPPSLAALVASWEFDPPGRTLTAADIAEAAGVSRGHARVLASRLVEAGWLHRVSRGRFEFVPAASAYPSGSEWLLLETLGGPYLISGLTAARHHRLTPQLPSRHLLILPADRPVPREIRRSERFRVVRQREERVVGAEETTLDRARVRVARLERVLLDAVQHPGWFSGIGESARILRRGLARVETGAMLDLLARWNETSVYQRLGWWADRLGTAEELRADLGAALAERTPGRPLLLPGGPRRGPTDKRWGVTVNVPAQALADEDVPR